MSASDRRGLLPRDHALAWTPYVWLVYLPIFFVQPVLRHASATGWTLHVAGAAVLLATYFRGYWLSGGALTRIVVVQALLGIVFSPFNTGAYVLFTYSASAAGRLERTRGAVWWIVGITVAGVAMAFIVHAPFYYWIGHGVFTPLIGVVCLHRAQADRSAERLRAANDEIQRLAAVAERERIARDLHDVLGHTLSLIVLKSELASKVADRDPSRAVREIRDVEEISRNALREVRETIRGYHARLDDEVVRAKRMLDAGGIELSVESTIAPEELEGRGTVEETLALALREAATNVARHSRARRARVRLWLNARGAGLKVADDGTGIRDVLPREGAGLRGMRERIESLGGRMTIDSDRRGTRLDIVLPIDTKPSVFAPPRAVSA
jgi:two-component system sensor histidine kinase DesK